MEVNDVHVGRQLQVSSGIGAGAAGPAVSPSPPALCFGTGPAAIPGTAWIENGLLVGSPITYPSPFLEAQDRKSTRLNSSHVSESRMPSSA